MVVGRITWDDLHQAMNVAESDGNALTIQPYEQDGELYFCLAVTTTAHMRGSGAHIVVMPDRKWGVTGTMH